MKLETVPTKDGDVVYAPYYAEEVRRELQKDYGDEALYRGGLSVRTSLDPHLQAIAETALQNGLINVDRKRGYRGAVKNVGDIADWKATLQEIPEIGGRLNSWQIAIVLSAGAGQAEIGLADGTRAQLFADDVTWARATKPLQKSDIILVEIKTTEKDGKKTSAYRLRHVPQIQGPTYGPCPRHAGRMEI